MTHRRRDNMDEVFRRKLQDYEADPSPYLFDEIDAHIQSEIRMRRKMIFIRSAAVVLLLIAFGIGYFTANYDRPDINTRIVIKQQGITPDKEQTAPGHKGTSENQPLYTIFATGDHEPIDQRERKVNTLDDTAKTEEPIRIMGNPKENQVAKVKTERMHNLNGSRNTQQYAAFMPRNTELTTPPLEEPEIASSAVDWKVGSSFSRYFALQTTKVQSQEQQQGVFSNDGMDFPMSTISGGVDVAVAPTRRLAMYTGVYFARREGVIGDVTLKFHGTSSSGAVNSQTQISSTILPDVQIDMHDANVEDLIELKQQTENIPRGRRIGANSSYYKFGLNLDQQYDYIEVPAGISYRIIDRKLKVSALAGLSASILINQQALLYNGEDVNLNVDVDGLSQYLYHSRLGLSVDVPVYKSLYFYLQPTYRRDLNSIYKDISQPSNPDRIAVFAGFNFTF